MWDKSVEAKQVEVREVYFYLMEGKLSDCKNGKYCEEKERRNHHEKGDLDLCKDIISRRMRYVEPIKVMVGEKQYFIWRFPFTKEEIVKIQESFLTKKLFFLWLRKFYGGSGYEWISKRFANRMQEGTFSELYETDPVLRLYYAYLFLKDKFEWDKTVKWFVIGSEELLYGERLMEFLLLFADQINELYLYESKLSEYDVEDITEEYGILPVKVKGLELMKECDLILDAGASLKMVRKYLPSKAVYIDLTENPDKRRYIMAKSGKIKYISLRNYLDRGFFNKL